MELNQIAQLSLLYDFYGQLLPARQRQVIELYHGENLSLAEIAEEFAISRQGVHDALKNAQKALQDYEEKLGLVEKFRRDRQAVREIDAAIGALAAESHDHAVRARLAAIQQMIDRQFSE